MMVAPYGGPKPPLRPLGIRWDGKRMGVAVYTGRDGRESIDRDRLAHIIRHAAERHLSGWSSECRVRILRPHGRAEHGAWRTLRMTDELAAEVVRRIELDQRAAERRIASLLAKRIAKEQTR